MASPPRPVRSITGYCQLDPIIQLRSNRRVGIGVKLAPGTLVKRPGKTRSPIAAYPTGQVTTVLPPEYEMGEVRPCSGSGSEFAAD